jgi:hypothetical protein
MRFAAELALIALSGFLIPAGCFAFFRLSAWLTWRRRRRL